jgi:hypothetical protein
VFLDYNLNIFETLINIKDIIIYHKQKEMEGKDINEVAASGDTVPLDSVHYKATGGTWLAREEIEKLKGKYDEDHFYVLEDGSSYDPDGYYFD